MGYTSSTSTQKLFRYETGLHMASLSCLRLKDKTWHSCEERFLSLLTYKSRDWIYVKLVVSHIMERHTNSEFSHEAKNRYIIIYKFCYAHGWFNNIFDIRNFHYSLFYQINTMCNTRCSKQVIMSLHKQRVNNNIVCDIVCYDLDNIVWIYFLNEHIHRVT